MALGDFPCLPPQSGDAKDAVRKEVRALFDQICCFYAPPKLFGYVAEGLKSKNSRQRFGEELESRHEEHDGWLGDVCTIVKFSVTLSFYFLLSTYVRMYLSQLTLSPYFSSLSPPLSPSLLTSPPLSFPLLLSPPLPPSLLSSLSPSLSLHPLHLCRVSGDARSLGAEQRSGGVSAVTTEGRPADCTLCGREGQLCAQRCPQHAGHLLREHGRGRVQARRTGELFIRG